MPDLCSARSCGNCGMCTAAYEEDDRDDSDSSFFEYAAELAAAERARLAAEATIYDEEAEGEPF